MLEIPLAHFCALVRDCLAMAYLSHWIGRWVLLLWPPQSPDRTSLDVFLWDYFLYEGFDVSRRSDYINRRSYSSTFCLYFGRHHSDVISAFIHFTGAQTCLDMYGGLLEQLPF
ncbi:hypothetical protein TNCV_2134151 [Trichonephila clavipes]|nr:hypothetical protein TNCV_2134151 [Trichonephila clavipes]